MVKQGRQGRQQKEATESVTAVDNARLRIIFLKIRTKTHVLASGK